MLQIFMSRTLFSVAAVESILFPVGETTTRLQRSLTSALINQLTFYFFLLSFLLFSRLLSHIFNIGSSAYSYTSVSACRKRVPRPRHTHTHAHTISNILITSRLIASTKREKIRVRERERKREKTMCLCGIAKELTWSAETLFFIRKGKYLIKYEI